ILAGDHLKSASDLGIPLVGVGLLYHQGYVRQELDKGGWQQDIMEPFDVTELPLEPARSPAGEPVRISVDLPGRRLFARALEAGAATVFTSHTPVEAGHDHFPADLAAEHLEPLAASLALPVGEVIGLGRHRPEDQGQSFCPTIVALKLARKSNGVSALHGAVA